MSSTIIRWNNLSKRFDTISVDALNEKVHDVGDARPTKFMRKVERDALEAQEKSKVKK